jgi:hypothetical protein
MHTFSKFLVLGLLFSTLTSCSTPSHRDPASTAISETTLSGTRVNPVRFTLAPAWKIRLHNGEKTNWDDSGKLDLTTYEIGSEQGFRDFKMRIGQLVSQNEAAAKIDKKGKGIFPKGAVLALNEVATLLSLIESRQLSERDQYDAFQHIAELASAFNYSFAYPIPHKLFILAAPLKLAAEFTNKPMDKDAGPAINVRSNGVTDVSLVNPDDSSFWQERGDISHKEMYVGFGRSEMPKFDTPCKYDEPKSNYGVHPGITVKCNGKKWKFKFENETHTEPFNSRIAWAMGYNVIPVDYVAAPVLEYDRKVIAEFNSRKPLVTRLSSGLGFDLTKYDQQLYYDPFIWLVKSATLTDGSQVDAKTLKTRLLKDQTAKAETNDANYNTEFESKIKYLNLIEASAEPSAADNEKNIGSWSWNDLDHPNRRETRGFAIVASFLNLFDVRTDNNKVRFIKEADGRLQLKHYISDLGSGLGRGSHLLDHANGDTNGYPWEMIAAIHERNDSPVMNASVNKHKYDKVIERYIFKGYSVIMNNESFNRMRVDDARWAARRLAKFSEAQFQDALIAAGWSAAEVRLYLEKFASRRDNLMKTFELDKQFALSRPQGANRKLNFDPRTDRALAVSSNPSIIAPAKNKRVVNGMVVSP